MNFGAMEELSSAPSIQLKYKISGYVQQASMSSARDPVHGFERLSYPKIDPEKGPLILQGIRNEIAASFASLDLHDQICEQL